MLEDLLPCQTTLAVNTHCEGCLHKEYIESHHITLTAFNVINKLVKIFLGKFLDVCFIENDVFMTSY